MTRLVRLSLALLLLGFGTVALGQNLVTNGSFGSGDFTGWMLSGNTSFTGVCNAETCPGGFTPDSNYGAFFGAVDEPTTLQQTVATTTGDQYTLSFYLADPQGGAPDYFAVNFGSASTTMDNFAGSFGWQEYELTTTANSSETVLSFSLRNNPGFWFLSNIMVEESPGNAPEPGTIVLFATGLLGIAGVARRKLGR